MINGFPCPNPSCKHVFPPAAVKGVAALTCPLCGTVFQFRAPAAPPAKGPAPAAVAKPALGAALPSPPKSRAQAPAPVLPQANVPPASTVPVPAKPAGPPPSPLPKTAGPAVVPPPPLAIPVAAVPGLSHGTPGPASPAAIPLASQDTPSGHSDSPFAIPPALVTSRRPLTRGRGQIPWMPIVIFTLAGAGVVGLAIWIAPLLSGKRLEKISDTFDWVSKEANFRLTVAKDEWKEDADSRQGLRAHVALEKEEQPIWLAIAAQDFGRRNARDAELEGGAIERLENYFKDKDLEWEPRPIPKGGQTPFRNGQAAQRIVFQGEHENVIARGECYMLRYRGIAYWLFIWAPQSQNQKWETTRKELEELQSEDNRGFILLNGRKGWEERPPEMEKYRGTKHGFTIHGLKGLWEEFPATDEDSNGDLYLQRRSPERRRNPVKGVNLLVSVLNKKPGTTLKTAIQEATNALLRRLPPVEEKPRAEPAPGQNQELGVERKVGNVPGRVVELRVTHGELQYLAVLAVVIRSKQVFVIQCQCPWNDRARWRGEFKQMLATFTLWEK
jgi:hypothetical protein